MTKNRKLAFTVVTGLFVLAALPGAIMNIVHPDVLLEMSAALGVPVALMTILGVWKLLGIAALLTPRAGRLKEWAYAGFFFDLSGAAYLHAVAGDIPGVAPALILLVGLVASYRLRPDR